VLLRLKSGGKGILTISQIATGEENNLGIRVYASDGSILWKQENPNDLKVYRYGVPRQTLTRASGYLAEPAQASTRVPIGHPEGYLEAFATIYGGAVEAIRRYIDGKPMKIEEYNFPTVYDGLRGMQFIYKAVESCDQGSIWVDI
jgi:predicted dehydrogenase